ncbi:MAG: hypothetical protein U5K30_14395 [Acidimicrobiales bacterium]|nr:hypothetical protein [Acidimicrobiales bacterium]
MLDDTGFEAAALGVLAEQGDYNGGWVWHLIAGQVRFAVSFVSEHLTELAVPVPVGATTLQVLGRPADGDATFPDLVHQVDTAFRNQ